MRAGSANAVITPELPVYLAGYGDRRDPATDVRDDLELRIVVVEDGDARAALVTCDLLAITRDTSDPIRAAVADVLDAPAAGGTDLLHARPRRTQRAHRHRRDRLARARRAARAAGRAGHRSRRAPRSPRSRRARRGSSALPCLPTSR